MIYNNLRYAYLELLRRSIRPGVARLASLSPLHHSRSAPYKALIYLGLERASPVCETMSRAGNDQSGVSIMRKVSFSTDFVGNTDVQPRGVSIWARLLSAIIRAREIQAEREVRRHLARRSDRELRDIGLTDAEIFRLHRERGY